MYKNYWLLIQQFISQSTPIYFAGDNGEKALFLSLFLPATYNGSR